MSWLYSRALVEEYLEANSSDGEQYALSNGSPMPLGYLPQDKMTEFSRLSRFGAIFDHLTESLGADLLTWFLADSLAKTYQSPDQAKESKASEADSGKRWHGLLARFDQDSYSWKTPQCSLLGDSESYSETWPRWGTMRNGESFLRAIPALPTLESESGFWATPTTMDCLPPKSEEALLREATIHRPGRLKPNNLRDQVSNMAKWPTPSATDYKGSGVNGQLRDRLDYAVERGATKSAEFQENLTEDGSRGQLSPMWVEWLMGWPIGWTDLKPLEMAKFHEWSEQHGTC